MAKARAKSKAKAKGRVGAKRAVKSAGKAKTKPRVKTKAVKSKSTAAKRSGAARGAAKRSPASARPSPRMARAQLPGEKAVADTSQTFPVRPERPALGDLRPMPVEAVDRRRQVVGTDDPGDMESGAFGDAGDVEAP